jgi:hypothetical protein
VKNIEEFALSAIKHELKQGAETIVRFAGDLISISEKPVNDRNIRFAQGAPAFIGWRILIISGAYALDLEEFNSASIIMREPMEIEELNGLFSHQSLIQRRRLFYPEVFLGYANYPIKYLANYWTHSEHLHKYFPDIEYYRLCIARMLIVIALATSLEISDDPFRHLYPGYRLILEARKAILSLCGRMATSQKYINGIAQVIGDTGDNLRETWDQRATELNKAGLGHGYIHNRIRFPIPMSNKVEEW